MSRNFDAVLFDFGGVFTGSPFTEVAAASSEFGLTPEELSEIMFGVYDKDTDHPWHRLERAEISFDDACKMVVSIAAERGLDLDPLEILMRINVGAESRTGLVERVKKLKEEGYLTGIITNNIAEFRDGWRALIPVGELFDIVVDSSVEGIRKPNPEIFHLALKRLGNIAPERSVFLDDYPYNISVANSLGIKGILVGEDTLEAIRELDKVLAG